jgi:uncharacterized membrane protein
LRTGAVAAPGSFEIEFRRQEMARSSPTANGPALLHPLFVAASAALLIGALVTDIVYAETLLFQWDNFSIWLITGGLIAAALAGLALIFDMLLGRAGPINWLRFVLLVGAALLSLLNALVHSRDAYTAVVPQGLMLSAVVTVILLIVVAHGWAVAAVRTPSKGPRS